MCVLLPRAYHPAHDLSNSFAYLTIRARIHHASSMGRELLATGHNGAHIYAESTRFWLLLIPVTQVCSNVPHVVVFCTEQSIHDNRPTWKSTQCFRVHKETKLNLNHPMPKA